MAKKRVVVLYGGRADEHSISCISTAGVLGAKDTERFEPDSGSASPRTASGSSMAKIRVAGTWDGGELPTVKITPGNRAR